MMFFRVFKHLLPDARAWRIVIDKLLRRFFEGLTWLPDDVREYLDCILLDLDPQRTRLLDKWEKQFGLPATVLTEQERRDRLDAAWKETGGQSPRYLQDRLQGAGFNVYIHEWWDPGSLPAAVPRNPLLVLNDGTEAIGYTAQDGGADMQDGGETAMDGATSTLTGYALVNKILILEVISQDGGADMQDGGETAMDGGRDPDGYTIKSYIVPSDSTKWPFFLYIGGGTYPEHAQIPSSRRNEFETLCLKLCPAHQWLGILVDYT